MRKLTTFLLIFFVALTLQGQKIVMYDGKVITYDGKVIRTEKYCAEAQSVFDAMGTEPDNARKALINTLIEGLKTDNIWSKLDFLYILAAHAENSSLLNWINPGTFDATNVHATAFETDRGYTGDGANDYLNSNYNPSTDAIYYLQDDASLGIYVRTNTGEDKVDIGNRNAGINGSQIITRFGNDKTYVAVNMSGGNDIANTDSKGFYIGSRVAVNDIDLYKNSSRIINETTASTAIINQNLYILARSTNGTANLFSTKQIAAAFAGGGMTQTNVNNFTDRLETFMDAIGAGIID